VNILVHSIYFPPEVGGLETHAYTLARSQVKMGHEVRVVTSRSGDFQKRENMEGIEVERVFCPNKKITGWAITSYAAKPVMRRNAPWADICHVHTFPSIIPGEVAHKRGVPLVATIHTSHFLRLAAKGGFWRNYLRSLISKPDILLTPSEEIRDVCLSLVPKARCYAMVNAADTDRFKRTEPSIPQPSESAKMLVVPRRLFEKNGVEYAVRALPFVRRRHNAHLYLIGDGPERAKLERIAEELQIIPYVHFEGAKPNDKMPGFLNSADVIVIPSLMEATSVAGLEAMACELPIVASNVGGLPEIISSETGRLVPPRQPEALAEAISAILELDEAERNEMGAKARKKVVENWSVDRLAEQVLEYYAEAAEIFRKGKA
jgi:glycosyltransferase involved in cell wall biosynthesis